MTLSYEIHQLASQTAYHNLGIVPISSVDLRHDFNRYLSSLPPEEARRMKRKFRKLWRAAAKNPSKFISERHILKMGLGSVEPTREEKLARKAEVSRRVMVDRVLPLKKMLSQINHVQHTTSSL